MIDDERLIRICDPDDPRIAAFRDIRERDLVGRRGFIAEGTVVVDQLLRAERFRAVGLLLLENRLGGLSGLLAKVPRETPVYVADRATYNAVAGFPVHRGVMAAGEATEYAGSTAGRLHAIAEDGGTVLVAVGIANHDNIGALFRNAAAFGVGMVLVDETSCDPLYRKALRVSVGSVLAVPYARVASGEEAVRRLEEAGFRCLALSPGASDGAAALDRGGATALFLGAEGPGLPAALLGRMASVAIAMAPGFDSLNVATAAAIALHRLFEANRASSRVPPSPSAGGL
ncbi:MAG: RNA methyltransferase [Rhizobiaceae bacterium]|nr:RNA methyltransferase [Rhizobiaceae bacterium]